METDLGTRIGADLVLSLSALTGHPLFGLALTAVAYMLGLWLYRLTRFPLLHPFPTATAIVCGVLLLTGTPYENYNIGGSYLTLLLSPATVCLAVPLYEKLPKIKKHAGAILLSLCVGCVTAIVSMWALSRAFGLPDLLLYSLVPKSVTTAIAVEVAASLGGLRTVAVLGVLIAGMTGALFGPALCDLFGLRAPLARGLAVGAASHALGTARAMEASADEGAAGGLAIGVCGLITALLAPALLRFLMAIW